MWPADLVVVVASLGGRGADVGAVRGCLDSAWPGLVVARQDEMVAVLPVTDTSTARVVAAVRGALALLAVQDIFPSVGISGAHGGWLAVPAAYEEVTHARSSLRGSPGLRMIEEMSTLDFLVHSQGEDGARLVKPAIRAFLVEDLESNGVFVATLKAYIAANLNAKEAAMALVVHPNTVYYRLERIAERTGCDVRRVEELIDLLLAVRLVRGD
jgi:DNA-binding PucR family transcriptional regulator